MPRLIKRNRMRAGSLAAPKMKPGAARYIVYRGHQYERFGGPTATAITKQRAMDYASFQRRVNGYNMHLVRVGVNRYQVYGYHPGTAK